jgi:hypothetical protein
LTACGEPHPIGLDPVDPGFRRRLGRDALTGRSIGALAHVDAHLVVTLLGLERTSGLPIGLAGVDQWAVLMA